MPELPEVEVVRRGLARHVEGRRIVRVDVAHPRSVRRHVGGAGDFTGRVQARRVDSVERRGKYLWLVLDDGFVLLAHLGMSGQLVLPEPGTADSPHLRARFVFDDAGRDLHFVDQRTFGHLAVDELVGDPPLPTLVAHIGRDLFDPAFDLEGFVTAVRRRRTGIKRALLDQTLVSGIGNIYADEALWRARVHWGAPTERLAPGRIRDLAAAAREVMVSALAQGGTSFDALYVDVNGASGYFSRLLAVYGREGLPCPRCGRPIRRDRFMNRSSYRCPTCQRTPRDVRR